MEKEPTNVSDILFIELYHCSSPEFRRYLRNNRDAIQAKIIAKPGCKRFKWQFYQEDFEKLADLMYKERAANLKNYLAFWYIVNRIEHHFETGIPLVDA